VLVVGTGSGTGVVKVSILRSLLLDELAINMNIQQQHSNTVNTIIASTPMENPPTIPSPAKNPLDADEFDESLIKFI
jgi:hypothetical protein